MGFAACPPVPMPGGRRRTARSAFRRRGRAWCPPARRPSPRALRTVFGPIVPISSSGPPACTRRRPDRDDGLGDLLARPDRASSPRRCRPARASSASRGRRRRRGSPRADRRRRCLTVSRPPLSMSPVESCFGQHDGVVRVAAPPPSSPTAPGRSTPTSAPSSVRHSGLSKAMRSPQHSDENGPPSMTRAQRLQRRCVQVGLHHRHRHPDSHVGILTRPPAD